MSATSWIRMIRNRNLPSSSKSHAALRRTKQDDPDYVKLDLTKDPHENILEIFNGICAPDTVTDAKLIHYLNNYVKLITHINFKLRLACVHDNNLVRTAGLRAVRYTLKTEEHVLYLNNLQIPYLISRSFDLALANDVERVQALKLIRRILLISPKYFDVSLGRPLAALANGAHEEKDRMLRTCLAALSELSVLNSRLFIRIGGVTAIIRNLLECQTPHIAESLCGTLLHLINHPATRDLAAIDLKCLAAPYCDFHYRRSTSANTNEMAEERELRFNCSRLALLSVLRSWPGIFHFCNPLNPTCLKAMVEILYLEHLEVKNAVLDLLYELLNLPQPEWTDEFSVALNAVDPADAQDSWRLRDGFVAAEARSLLPHLARTTPNLAEIHLSVLLYTFIEVGLFTALAEVIISGDTFICVRATILLGVLLHWTHQLLPPDCCNITPSLPNLVMDATNKHQALSAVAALQDLHTMLKQRPASYSLFLDHILMSSSHFKASTLTRNVTPTSSTAVSSGKSPRSGFAARTKMLYQLVNKDSEKLLRDSNVLQNKDGRYTWDWDIIRTILKTNSVDMMQKIDDSNYKAFLKRLQHYFKPSSNLFSHMDLSSSHQAQKYTLAGCDLIHFLLNTGESEYMKLLTELFKDISTQIEAITASKSAHDCLFSPQHMSSTCCQMYFLFIGHMTHSQVGLDILDSTGVFEQLLKLVTSTNHDCYVKLIISSLDYTEAACPRTILSKTLTCNIKSSRLYATQFLLALLRAKVYDFEQWGVDLLVNQLYDQSKAISLTALNILHEACEERVYLERLVQLKPDLINLGDKGLLLLIRFLSTPSGFTFLHQTNFVNNEIRRWITNFNYRYVRIVEEELHDALSLHQRNEDGHYNRRISSVKTVFRRDIFVPPHLYGQLVQHSKGFTLLMDNGNLMQMFKCIETAAYQTENDVLELKAALWACGSIATSSLGVDLLATNNVFAATVNVATTCPVYSVRGTALYVLGIMSTTFRGANELFRLGWACARHDRHEQWPVIEGENWHETQPSSNGAADDSLSPQTGGSASAGCWRRSDKESESSDRISDNSSVMQCWTEEHRSQAAGDFCLPDVDGSSVIEDDDIFLNHDNETQKKSKTLPHGSLHPRFKHERSISESKTIEIMTDKSEACAAIIAAHATASKSHHRHRDVSESSTSGVSSCDSVVGKYNYGERISTLSPIPSSSSLSTLKPYLSYQHHRRTRHVSESATISPTESARLSHQDLMGYTTWRTLRHQHRPFYVNTSDDELSTIVSASRSLKDRSQYTQLSLTDLEGNNLPNPILTGGSQTSMVKRTSLLRNSDKIDGPSYLGVCLPRRLLDIFPIENISAKHAFKANESDNTSLNVDEDESSGVSSVLNNQITSSSIHERKLCLLCCRRRSSIEDLPLTELFSPASSDQPSTSQTDSQETRLKIDILKHAERLSNPIPPWYKQSRQALLHMKQKHPSLFQDICLYSEVCVILSSVSMRLIARRFLQELFQDLNFDSLFNEPREILALKTSTPTPAQHNPVTDTEESEEEEHLNVRRLVIADCAQRTAELSEVLQPRNKTATSTGKVYSSYRRGNVTTTSVVGTVVLNELVRSNNESVVSENNGFSGPVRSPPLASVKEETLTSMENLLNASVPTKPEDVSCSDSEDKSESISERLVSPRGQKTLVNSLSLTYNQNKFPITTRYHDTVKDIASYRAKNCIYTSPTTTTTTMVTAPAPPPTTTIITTKANQPTQ